RRNVALDGLLTDILTHALAAFPASPFLRWIQLNNQLCAARGCAVGSGIFGVNGRLKAGGRLPRRLLNQSHRNGMMARSQAYGSGTLPCSSISSALRSSPIPYFFRASGFEFRDSPSGQNV